MDQFKEYSIYYDAFYKNKSYEVEAKAVLKTIAKYSQIPVREILSIGCGTGTYERIFAEKGFEVLGFDKSRQMLREARKKLQNSLLPVQFMYGDVRKFKIGKKFDAVVALFNIAGYQNTNEEVKQFVVTANNHLKRGWLFLFDAWYLPAVLKDPPQNRIKTVKMKGVTLTRLTTSRLNVEESIIDITFTVSEKHGRKLFRKIKEKHPMRCFTINELRYFFTKNGFSFINASCFPKIEKKISQNQWNMLVSAKKL